MHHHQTPQERPFLWQKVIMDLAKVTEKIRRLELFAVNLLTMAGSWIAPIPSAYRVGYSVEYVLGWHPVIAWITGIAVEVVGVVSIISALDLYQWNRSKAKSDPAAPIGMAVFCVAAYFFTVVSLTVFLEVFDHLQAYAPALMPFLALVGGLNIAVRNGQQGRVLAKEKAKEERRKARRKGAETMKATAVSPEVTDETAKATAVSQLSGNRLAVYTAYVGKNGDAPTRAAVGRNLGISGQAVGQIYKTLVEQGLLKG